MATASFPSQLPLLAASLRAAGQPGQALAALDQVLRQRPGHKLFTVLLVDEARGVSRRIYTSDPIAYPCGGTKPLRRASAFYEQVLVAGEPRICRTAGDCREAFPDFAQIAALGCGSALNYPVRFDGASLGSLNLLHEEGWYGAESLPDMDVLASFALPAMLHSLSQRSSTP